MKNKKGLVIALIAMLLTTVPVFAVFDEKDLPRTLSVLRFELHEQNERMENLSVRLAKGNEAQHRQMVEMFKKCNELALILYSQNKDFTFDMTYALKEVTDQYNEFSDRRMPYDEIVENLNLEIDRYERLIESLRRLPPMLDEIEDVPDSISLSKDSMMFSIIPETADKLAKGNARAATPKSGPKLIEVRGYPTFFLDEQGLADRDTCIAYARNLLRMYTNARDRIVEDNTHYSDMSKRLKESYDYAQDKYRLIQRNIFVKGQDNYFVILGSLPFYTRFAIQEVKAKYGKARKLGDIYDDGCEVTEEENMFSAVAEVVGIKSHEEDEEDHVHSEDETEEEHAVLAAHDEEHHHHHHHHDANQSEWRGPIVVAFIFVVLFYILIASALSNIIIILLRRKMKWFKNDDFRNRQACTTLLCGVVIFAITIMIANRIVDQHFITLASSLLLIFAWLMTAVLSSILIRVPSAKINRTLLTYLPMICMGLIVIFFRIIFIPNRMVNLIYPPILLVFTIWQLHLCHKCNNKVEKVDMTYAWISCFLFGACTVISWFGFVLMSVQIFIWWLFQFAAITSVSAIYDMLRTYEDKKIQKKRVEYRLNHTVINDKSKGAFIRVTWLFDLVKDAAIPVIAILSLPVSLWLAADVFDLTEICKTIFHKPFFDLVDSSGNEILHLSLYKIVIVTGLFYIFKYLAYVSKAFYRHYRLQSHMEQSGKGFVHANEINFTLADNLISILIWGTYIIMTIILMKIPMGALSVVAAGLATGIGLALKDVLNNFIYGIQLMSGRLRVGDYIDCDGIRGKVESITYQSTQIETLEGSIMAITNTSLFNKNFQNLTKNNSYELVKIPVGVHYGANVSKVREVLLEALKTLQTKDKYGRQIVEPKYGITVAFSNFGDSSVDLVVKQYILVDQEPAYIASAKELIYNTLNENDIEIPFPQRDVYIRQIPSTEK